MPVSQIKSNGPSDKALDDNFMPGGLETSAFTRWIFAKQAQ